MARWRTTRNWTYPLRNISKKYLQTALYVDVSYWKKENIQKQSVHCLLKRTASIIKKNNVRIYSFSNICDKQLFEDLITIFIPVILINIYRNRRMYDKQTYVYNIDLSQWACWNDNIYVVYILEQNIVYIWMRDSCHMWDTNQNSNPDKFNMV